MYVYFVYHRAIKVIDAFAYGCSIDVIGIIADNNDSIDSVHKSTRQLKITVT